MHSYYKAGGEPSLSQSSSLPNDLLALIFQCLKVNDLKKVPQLSRTCQKIFWQPSFWKEKATNNEMQRYLDWGLFKSVKKNKSEAVIKRYCDRGANANVLVKTTLEQKSSIFSGRGGFFVRATTLGVAVNHFSGKKAKAIVEILLAHGANPLAVSIVDEYLNKSAGMAMYMVPAGQKQKTALELAQNSELKAILILAELELSLSTQTSSTLLVQLKMAYTCDRKIVRTYLNEIREAEGSLTGYCRELSSNELIKFKNPELDAWYEQLTELDKQPSCCLLS